MTLKNVSLASWVQAISTLALVLLAIWAGFFSEVGDLAIERLSSDLSKTKQQMESIHKEKEELEAQKLQLQYERDELAQLREDHITNVYLQAVVAYGFGILSVYESEAKAGQGLLALDRKVEPNRNWNRNKKVMPTGIYWEGFYFLDPEKPHTDGKRWKCSKSEVQILEDSFKNEFDPKGSKSFEKWQQDRDMDYLRDMADYGVSCFNEWEYAVRERIESTDNENVFTIEDFSKKLLQYPGINNAGEKIFNRIQEKLTEEISSNTMLANLPIKLRVTRDASLQEIKEEADRILMNVKIARDWLDKATSSRYTDEYTYPN
ncbi:MAG: hypothetical protein OXK72_03255 [Gammaproteobacteria bacterium]|nr:hypothetical protein [Gammaproteobacteria bacterium]MDE0411071.1 hypothetical protein [Gammaproteobacteria bacterium]